MKHLSRGLAAATALVATLAAAAPEPPAYPVDTTGRVNPNAVCVPCRGFAQYLRANEDNLAAMRAEFERATAAVRALTEAALNNRITPEQRVEAKKDAKIAEFLEPRIAQQEIIVTAARTTLDACLKEKCTAQPPRPTIEIGGGVGGGVPGGAPGGGPGRAPLAAPSGGSGACDCDALLAEANRLRAEADEERGRARYQAILEDSLLDEIQKTLASLQEIDPGLTPAMFAATPYYKALRAQKNAAENAKDDFNSSANRLALGATVKMEQYERCMRACTPAEPKLQVVINTTGNNPFNPSDPLGGRTPTGGTPQPPANAIGRIRLSPTSVVSVTEGDSVTFTVDRIEGAAGNISVQFEAVSEGATPGVDFAAANGSFTWADGDTSPRSVTIPTVDDNIAEGQEAFSFRLRNPGGGATLAEPSSARVFINDRGAPPPAGSVQFNASAYSTAEGQGSVTITATRVGGTNGAIAVQYRTDPQSATAGADYGPVNGTLTWANGDASSKSFTVSIVDDTLVENPETFLVVLSGPTLNGTASGMVLGAPASATVTIQDNDVSVPVGPCGPQGNAWQPNTGAAYNCSGSCVGMASSQTVTVQGDVVTVTPFDEGPPAPVAFPGCGASVSSTRGDLSFFVGMRRHRGTITRTSNNNYSITVVTTSGSPGQCIASCSRGGP